MDGKILDSEGQYVAYIRANQIYDLSGKKLYDLRGQKIYKPTGELVVHHSDFDVLIPSHSRMGKLSGGTRISMLLGTPG